VTLDLTALIREFVTLFVVIDPVGTIPVYLFAAQSVPKRLHRKMAIRAVGIATLVLFAFMAGGQYLLETLGLRFGSFQIAGGIILFLFAMTMIFGESKPAREIEEAGRDHLAGAVFPLAIPSIASPGAMLAVVVLTDNHTETIADQAVTGGLLFLVLLLTLGLLLAASAVYKIIGNTGASVISRVMGIVLATIAIDAIVGGFDALGGKRHPADRRRFELAPGFPPAGGTLRVSAGYPFVTFTKGKLS
jgi:multiple antibiotic resistance protein